MIEEFIEIDDVSEIIGAYDRLTDTVSLLKSINKIGFVDLTGKDVVRHELVQHIIEAYDKFGKK